MWCGSSSMMNSGPMTFQQLVAAAACLFVVGANSSCGKDAKAASLKNVAPAIVLRNLSGEYVFLSNLCYPGKEKPRKPRSVVVLNFMASDCVPCLKELPLFLEVVREYKKKAVKAFLVATDPFSKQEDLKKLIKDLKVDCEVLLDPHKVACKKFGIKGIPQTFVLSPTRQIIATFGSGDDFEKSLRQAIEKSLR